MTVENFTVWIKRVNAEMKKGNRKILMLLDNAPVHPKDLDLSNVELFFFQSNVTSLIQPLDQGIIKAFKDGYRKCLLSDITSRFDIDLKGLSRKTLEYYNQRCVVVDN